MKWITREHVKVDRVACPWLIKKFVDTDAEFLFVPNDQVMEVAQREGAIPYDVKNVELGHHGKECSFEAILKKYDLTNDAALVLLGKIVNGADTDNTLWHQPEGEGTSPTTKRVISRKPASMWARCWRKRTSHPRSQRLCLARCASVTIIASASCPARRSWRSGAGVRS